MIMLSHERRQPEPRSLERGFPGRKQLPCFNPSRVVHLTMLRRSLSTFLIGLIAVLNGMVVVLGPGLHALPGFGHHAIANCAIRVDDGLRVASGGDNAATCPICEYLAQGQVVAERAYVVAPNLSTHSIPALPSIPPDLRPRRAFTCRAPPAAHTL
jgi:hypothetical protein